MPCIWLNCPANICIIRRTFQIFWVQVSVNVHPNSGNSKYWPLGNLSCCCLAKEWPQGPFFLQDPVQQRHNFVEPLERSAYFPSNGARHAMGPPVNYNKCHTYLKNCLWILRLCWLKNICHLQIYIQNALRVYLRVSNSRYFWCQFGFRRIFVGLAQLSVFIQCWHGSLVVKQNVMYCAWQRYFRNQQKVVYIQKCCHAPPNPIQNLF